MCVGKFHLLESNSVHIKPHGQIQEFKGGGLAEFSSKKGGGGGGALTREQFVLQINKIFSKRGWEGGYGPPGHPSDLPLVTTLSHACWSVDQWHMLCMYCPTTI